MKRKPEQAVSMMLACYDLWPPATFAVGDEDKSDPVTEATSVVLARLLPSLSVPTLNATSVATSTTQNIIEK